MERHAVRSSKAPRRIRSTSAPMDRLHVKCVHRWPRPWSIVSNRLEHSFPCRRFMPWPGPSASRTSSSNSGLKPASRRRFWLPRELDRADERIRLRRTMHFRGIPDEEASYLSLPSGACADRLAGDRFSFESQRADIKAISQAGRADSHRRQGQIVTILLVNKRPRNRCLQPRQGVQS